MLIFAYDSFLKKYGSFTAIQNIAIPIVESGKNCLIIAHTGSGKTEAAFLPTLKRLADSKNRDKGILALYITPLRALNRDIIKRMQSISEESGFSISVRHGDTPQSERQKQVRNPPHIIITTPESLQSMFLSPRLRSAFRNLKAVIIDELHELYSNKRGAQLAVALERLEELAENYQRIGISATIGNIDSARELLCPNRECVVANLAKGKEIAVSVEMPDKPKSEHREFEKKFELDLQSAARIERIAELIKGSESALVFANTRQEVESLGSKLIYYNKQEPFGGIAVHHGSLDKLERIKVENAFKSKEIRSIIATSSLELGIDIGSVNMVVQYGSPRQAIRLAQRIGRGGHSEKEVSAGKIIVGNPIDALESLSIAEQVRKGEIEKQDIESHAMDVLANQLCALALEYKEISKDKAFQIIKRAAPYRNLTAEEFKRLLEFVAGLQIIRIGNDRIAVGSRGRSYFYSNISVIPETYSYYVKDAISNKTVATLDERFVSSYLDEGASFIAKGTPWKVTSIEEETVYAEPSTDLEAAIPDWKGEEIPVTYETAQHVFDFFGKGISKEDAKLMDANANQKAGSLIKRQNAFFEKSRGRVLIEETEKYALIYLPLGNKANEFIARMISYILSATGNQGITARATPYLITLDYSESRKSPNLERIMDSLKTIDIAVQKRNFVINSELFRYKFLQVAKLFGIVEKKAKMTRSNSLKLVDFYKDSVVAEETLRDLEKNYFDIKVVEKFLSNMRNAGIEVAVIRGFVSPLGEEILRANYNYREFLLSTAPAEEELKEFERHAIGETAELLCTYCGFEFSKKIENYDEGKISCHSCKSPMVCMFTEDRKEIIEKRLAGKKLSEKEQEAYENMVKETGLVEAYGNRALIALSTYGIGLVSAARALRMLRRNKLQFYTDLIEAQKNFIRTKKFWKK